MISVSHIAYRLIVIKRLQLINGFWRKDSSHLLAAVMRGWIAIDIKVGLPVARIFGHPRAQYRLWSRFDRAIQERNVILVSTTFHIYAYIDLIFFDTKLKCKHFKHIENYVCLIYHYIIYNISFYHSYEYLPFLKNIIKNKKCLLSKDA